MSSAPPNPLAEDLLALAASSPDGYLQKIDLVREAALITRIDRAGYRAASFLDDRILTSTTQGAWLPLPRVATALGHASSAHPLHYIFHTGHVGSTLASRLVEETSGTLALREPLPLRTLADAHDELAAPWSLLAPAQFAALTTLCMASWRRDHAHSPAVVVKATSTAGRIAAPLLAADPAARAIYMNLRAEPYLTALLSGQHSPQDLRGHGPGRMRRLQARINAPLAPLYALSLGELAALSWLVETWSQHDAIAAFPDRVVAIDFDAMLAGTAETMATILRQFDLPVDKGRLARVQQSPVLGRYSKAPEYAYTPQLRAEVLGDARRTHSGEIRKGLAWLDTLARSDAGVDAVLARSRH